METLEDDARSLVGMTQGSRKRLRRRLDDIPLGSDLDDFDLRLGERLRPCPGCCACWGCTISPAYGEQPECSGPNTNGKTAKQIMAMKGWQERLQNECDGSGVLPAKRKG
jgi:hypothetical protein